jgi:hypothetical protein
VTTKNMLETFFAGRVGRESIIGRAASSWIVSWPAFSSLSLFHRSSSKSSFQTLLPLLQNGGQVPGVSYHSIAKIAYYEIIVDDCDTFNSVISLGLAPETFNLKGALVGESDTSYGYFSNGKTVTNNDYRSEKDAIEFGGGDTVGCGLHVPTGHVFFTHNGTLGTIASPGNLRYDTKSGTVYPTVSCKGQAQLRFVFGNGKFRFNSFKQVGALCKKRHTRRKSWGSGLKHIQDSLLATSNARKMGGGQEKTRRYSLPSTVQRAKSNASDREEEEDDDDASEGGSAYGSPPRHDVRPGRKTFSSPHGSTSSMLGSVFGMDKQEFEKNVNSRRKSPALKKKSTKPSASKSKSRKKQITKFAGKSAPPPPAPPSAGATPPPVPKSAPWMPKFRRKHFQRQSSAVGVDEAKRLEHEMPRGHCWPTVSNGRPLWALRKKGKFTGTNVVRHFFFQPPYHLVYFSNADSGKRRLINPSKPTGRIKVLNARVEVSRARPQDELVVHCQQRAEPIIITVCKGITASDAKRDLVQILNSMDDASTKSAPPPTEKASVAEIEQSHLQMMADVCGVGEEHGDVIQKIGTSASSAGETETAPAGNAPQVEIPTQIVRSVSEEDCITPVPRAEDVAKAKTKRVVAEVAQAPAKDTIDGLSQVASAADELSGGRPATVETTADANVSIVTPLPTKANISPTASSRTEEETVVEEDPLRADDGPSGDTGADAPAATKPFDAAWTNDDVCRWVSEKPPSGLGLPQYVDNFKTIGIDGELLPEIQDSDLKDDMGISVRLHRLKVLKGIKKLIGPAEPLRIEEKFSPKFTMGEKAPSSTTSSGRYGQDSANGYASSITSFTSIGSADDLRPNVGIVAALFANPLVFHDKERRANPMPSLDWETERKLLRNSLRDAGGHATITFSHATTDTLRTVLTKGCHVLHYSGHANETYLSFEDGAGGLHCLGNERLQELFAAGSGGGSFLENGDQPNNPDADTAAGGYFRKPNLVFVSACRSKKAGEAFLAAGAKHVVCVETTSEIEDRAAQAFTKAFYTGLACGRNVDDAFYIGKVAVSSSPQVGRGLAQMAIQESNKFLLLPVPANEEDQRHAVPIFPRANDANGGLLEWVEPPPLSWEVLPALPEGFVYRQLYVYEAIAMLLARSRRIVTLTGPEGIGKSTIAKACAHYLADRKAFRDGILYVRAEKCRSVDQIGEELICALEERTFRVNNRLSRPTKMPRRDSRKIVDEATGTVRNADGSGSDKPPTFLSYLVHHLRSTQCLIVLDDLNHSINVSPLLTMILERCHKVQVMCVSQKPLAESSGGLGDFLEHIVNVGPMTIQQVARLIVQRTPPSIKFEDLVVYKAELNKIKTPSAACALAQKLAREPLNKGVFKLDTGDL